MTKERIRPGRPDDECWQYVDKVDEKRWICKYCKKSFAGSITRVKAHLAGIPRQISACRGEVPDNVKQAASQGFSNPPQVAGAKGLQANEVSSSFNTSNANFIEYLLEQPLYSDDMLGLPMGTPGLETSDNQPLEGSWNQIIPTEDIEHLQLRESPPMKRQRSEVMDQSMNHREFIHGSTDDEPQLHAYGNGGTIPNNTNAPKSDNESQLSAYYNSGTQNIRGIINQSGYIKGNGNGVINLGTFMASASNPISGNCTTTPPPTQPYPDSQQKHEALVKLVGTLNMIDEGKNDSATSQPSCSPASESARVTIGAKFNNIGRSNIVGLNNQIGYVEGNANGVINLGELII